MKLRTLGLLAGLLVLSSGTSQAEPLGFGTASAGGITNKMGIAIAKAAIQEGLNIRIRAHRGSSQHVPLVNGGKLKFGLANSLEVSNAFTGNGAYSDRAQTNLRLVGATFPFAVALGAPTELGLNSVSDIKGYRIAREFRAAPVVDTLTLGLMANGGIGPEDTVAVPIAGFGQAYDDFVAGRFDVLLLTMFGPRFAQLTQQMGSVTILPVDPSDEAMAALKAHVPVGRAVTIEPSPTLPGLEKPIAALGYDYLVFTNADLDDESAYRLAKAMHQNKAMLAESYRAFNGFDPDNMRVHIGVPYHPGAERFYREIGLAKGE